MYILIIRRTLLYVGSLRILQHVGTIKVPVGSLEALACTKPEEIEWKEKRFEEGPGMITELIQVHFTTLRFIVFVVDFEFVVVMFGCRKRYWREESKRDSP